MPEVIFIKRETTDQPFGFKLQGGADFSVPLSILQITPHSIADLAGLRPGDAITHINGVETNWMEHSRAKTELIRCGNDFKLTIERNVVDVNKPQHTPLSQLKSNPPVPKTMYTSPPPAPKTDLTVDKGEYIAIGSSHNRAPMPFNKQVGNGIDYVSSKPTNWKPGDYTKWANEPAAKEQPTVTAVFHNQYNTPIGMYSDSNVFQEFQNQTKGLMADLNNNNNNKQNSSESTTSSFQNTNYLQHLSQKQNPVRGANSLSMRMLNTGIQEVEGTNNQPPSVFDIKRGVNPTGASVPRGFRSVQAPTALPPEQRHAPMRKEFQVQHVAQNWIEPKIN